jgi:uncharacterized membrane protein
MSQPSTPLTKDHAMAVDSQLGGGRPGLGWWLLALAATGVAAYGLLLQDARPRRQTVPGLPWLDAVHFLAGGIALAIGIWAFRRDVLRRWPQLHRRCGQLYVVAVLASGGAGLGLALFSAGGVAGHLGFTVLALAWLATTLRGWQCIHRGAVLAHRRWMVHSYALCCAAISLRLQLPICFGCGLTVDTTFALVAWSCWLPNTAIAAGWLRATDAAGRWRVAAPPAPAPPAAPV